MIDRIQLTEYREELVRLSEADAHFIDTYFSDKVTIRREPFGRQYLLNPNQHVGVIMLPSGRRLESQSKVPVRNIFYMIAVANNLSTPFRDDLAEYAEFDEVLEFVAEYFADKVEDRIARGLYRAYVEVENDLPYVRGRIEFE